VAYLLLNACWFLWFIALICDQLGSLGGGWYWCTNVPLWAPVEPGPDDGPSITGILQPFYASFSLRAASPRS
jgi:hypothetical protein